ncbi:MAG TPA: thiamine-phosphate pyrophosphorylase [bacterium]|nr:thiamine-phosphate pyrophosphorylase [bacterium]
MKEEIYRIFDANINRAREGLRVCEEVARFSLCDERLTKKLKGIRHQVTKIIQSLKIDTKRLFAIRDVRKDVGARTYPKSEGRRRSYQDIVTSNMKRVEESLRVLEEFTKKINPSAGARFKRLRFQAYDLERELLEKLESGPRRAGSKGSGSPLRSEK